ncbi:MAG TPA: XdhC/CoxI family protein [Clostridia bacterium]|nr:XdhC/CoxI family protein [Clostridia bacterium]
MRTDFIGILDSVRQGLPATLELDIGGVRYFRIFRPKERLILLGGGHIAQPLCTFAAALDFSVTVVDDRPSFANRTRFLEADSVLCDAFPHAIRQLKIQENDYVAVITRGHRWDADCLRAILPGTMPKYLGMIGSKRRTTGLLQLLEEEGLSRSKLDLIHTPIGLDIGALTIQEIAVSILAELIKCRRQGTDRHANKTVLTSEDIDLDLLKFLAEDETPKALLLVYDTSGSTPVKSGALMAIDVNSRTAGTIGGGCSENAVLRDAYALIGTGGRRRVTVDMSNDVAEEEGMVCGGRMKVLIADVTG